MIVIQKDLTVINVTMKMDSAPASQTFLATSVTNEMMDSLSFQTVEVGFICHCYQVKILTLKKGPLCIF